MLIPFLMCRTQSNMDERVVVFFYPQKVFFAHLLQGWEKPKFLKKKPTTCFYCVFF